VIDLDISISNQREKKIKKKYEFIKILWDEMIDRKKWLLSHIKLIKLLQPLRTELDPSSQRIIMVSTNLLTNKIIVIRWVIPKVDITSLWDIRNDEIILVIYKIIISRKPPLYQFLKQS
jgi:hypothetical protein